MFEKREVVTRSWKKLRNEELHNLYSTSNIIKAIRPLGIRFEGSM
jgi:hypothetical protein